MTYTAQHASLPPSRDQVDGWKGLAILEFGTPWCGHCQRSQPFVEQVLAGRAEVAHTKVEDGPGQPLGRSYRVKLWPTLVFLKDGQEVARVVRPTDAQALHDALQQLAA